MGSVYNDEWVSELMSERDAARKLAGRLSEYAKELESKLGEAAERNALLSNELDVALSRLDLSIEALKEALDRAQSAESRLDAVRKHAEYMLGDAENDVRVNAETILGLLVERRKCFVCGGDGFIEGKDYADGSSSTARPCPNCDESGFQP